MANSNRRRTTVSGSARLSSEETVDSLRAAIAHLRSEFDAERKCVRRLRREKAYEVQLAREQERNKAAISMREMAAKLHQEKEQEAENLRCKHRTDIVKVMKQKDKETKKIRKDLAKCQDDLKEEIFKRGLSTSARAAFELERSKLLQDIKELSASRKLSEDALSSALEAEKQRTNELRLLQETSRTEIAKVNRDANTEIKRLLEELKTKDHVVSAMKGNHSTISRSSFVRYPPDHRSIGLAELVNLSKEIEAWQKRFSATSVTAEVTNQGGYLPNFNLQRKLYEIEKQLKHVFSVSCGFTEKNNELISINKALEQRVCAVVEQNNALNIDMRTAKGEIRRLYGLMSATGINNLTADLENLQGQLEYYENRAKLEKRNFKPKKTVRFLLPFEDHEMCDGDDSNRASYDDGEGDKGGGGDGDELEMLDSSETTISLLVADISVEENQNDVGEQTAKHLEMEHLCHQLNFSHEENPKQLEDWRIQKESLKIVIQTLEDKVKRFEDDEQKLKLKLQEVCDQNEELEFQILELENGTDEKKLQWEKENETLKSELLDLKNQVMSHYESNDVMERSVATQCGEELLATDMEEQENLFHKLTDEYKISLGVEWEKDFHLPCEATNFVLPQNLSNLGQKNHECGSLHSATMSESCSSLKMVTDMEELLSKTKIGMEQGGASSAKCDKNQQLCKNEVASQFLQQVKSCDGDGGDGDGVTGEGLMAHDRRKEEMKWMSEVESLKRKLNRSQAREREMKDQLMLLEEEKNRQIKLLQQQMDLLEGPNTSNQQIDLEMEERGTGQADNNCGRPDVERHTYDGELVPMNRDGSEEFYEKTERIVELKLDTTLNWITTPADVFMSTPVSGDFSVCPSLEYSDSREELLHQQVSDLERDRDLLSEIIEKDESIIHELQLEISKLHQSETDLQRIVERLEMAEEQMRRKTDDVTIQNDDMEKTIEELKQSESMLLSNVRKMRSTEFELKMRLEEIVEENRSNESKWKRRMSEVEIEKRLLQGKVKELDEQVGDHEGTEIVLKQKIKKLEKSDIYLRRELEDARQECNTLTCHIADLEFEKDLLMQRLEKQNLDFTTKVVHLKQEKEAMNVEMIEIGCRVKILEQTLASKEGTVSALELKLHKSEVWERELKRKLLAFENMNQLILSRVDEQQVGEMSHEPASKTVEFGSSELLELTGSDYFENCKDCHKRGEVEELVSSQCANDDQPVATELQDDVSKESLSLTSYQSSSSRAIPSDDVEIESADEASEIIDEDDGASPPPDGCSINPEDCWQQLLTPSHPCSSFHHLNRQTESPSLDSMNDSGLESLKQDGQVSSGHENSVCHENHSLTVVKPNAYRHGNQSHRVSMIPISIRYLTMNTCTRSDYQNLACAVCNDADSVESQDSQDYIGQV